MFYIGIYLALILFLWAFFFIARHHAYKYKHFSNNIPKITEILFIILVILSITGFVLLFFLSDFSPQAVIDSTARPGNINF